MAPPAAERACARIGETSVVYARFGARNALFLGPIAQRVRRGNSGAAGCDRHDGGRGAARARPGATPPRDDPAPVAPLDIDLSGYVLEGRERVGR
jgi:hypothetical protein